MNPILAKTEIIKYGPEVIAKPIQSTTFGIEQEFFIRRKDAKEEFVLGSETRLHTSDLDGCGFLAEVRTIPVENPWLLIGLLQSEITRIETDLNMGGHELVKDIAMVKLPKNMLYTATRSYGKGISEDECLYGEVKKDNYQTAGLHIHFGFASKVINIPKIIKSFDSEFVEEIKQTHRQKGLYEMKPYGFEYRSLPTTVDLLKAIRVIIGNKL